MALIMGMGEGPPPPPAPPPRPPPRPPGMTPGTTALVVGSGLALVWALWGVFVRRP